MPETKDLEWTFNTAAYAYDKFRPHFKLSKTLAPGYI